MTKPKRDFIFIDESGDPGLATSYYIQALLHITDESLKKLNVQLGAFRYFGCVRRELKSTRLNKLQKEQLLNILKLSISDNSFIKATAVYVDKKQYSGPYLLNTNDQKGTGAATKFRHFIIRKLLEFHFQNEKSQSDEIEIIIDRFHSDEKQEQQMRNYLRTDKYNRLPAFKHIIQADSRYLELLQITDWIAGSVKDKFFVHLEREYADLFKYIKVKQIVK